MSLSQVCHQVSIDHQNRAEVVDLAKAEQSCATIHLLLPFLPYVVVEEWLVEVLKTVYRLPTEQSLLYVVVEEQSVGVLKTVCLLSQ